MKTYNKIILTILLTLIIGYILYRLTCQFKNGKTEPGDVVTPDVEVTTDVPEIEIKVPQVSKDTIDIAINGN